jgi:hypothetical protein
MSKMGRPNIFGRQTGDRLQGKMTKIGSIKFEAARKRLSVIAKWEGAVSDADTIEFLARGEVETRKFLECKKNS